MKTDDKKRINNIVDDQIANILDNLVNNNIEIRKEEDELRKASKEMQKVLLSLDEKQRGAIDKYFCKNQRLEGKYFNKIYVQSFKDCIKLLKYIDVI
ncbi:hypothetical protein R9X47_25760 [Wukongibacter baidiensis]|uniref:hypothetical protein n=1 Tax=Wukongibacter baidiensis TaxID=1723361 RepID=UPI003D7F4D1D